MAVNQTEEEISQLKDDFVKSVEDVMELNVRQDIARVVASIDEDRFAIIMGGDHLFDYLQEKEDDIRRMTSDQDMTRIPTNKLEKRLPTFASTS